MPMTQRLKQLTKIKPKLTSSLGVIIVAAILLELISAVQYYYTRGLLEQELEHRAESELMAKMNLICKSSVTIGTSTALYDERNHACNHRHNGHQDRSQTFLTSSKSSITDGHALSTALRSELGNQDSRLRQETYQHDHTCLQVNIIVHARQME